MNELSMCKQTAVG